MRTVPPRPKNIPVPEGFTRAQDPLRPELPADYFEGPRVGGDGWIIETTFTFTHGVTIEIHTPGDYLLDALTPEQAFAAGVKLAQIGHQYAAGGSRA